MTKDNKPKKNHFDFPEPTNEEIELLQKKMAKEQNIDMPKAEAAKIVNLVKELDWWLEREKNKPTVRVTEEMAIEFQELVEKKHGKEIPLSEAYDEARSLLVFTEYKEKERLTKEIRAIMVTYAPIPHSQSTEEKLAKLFKLQYELDLTKDQQSQIVQFLTRNLWYEEGFNTLLEKYLDDLLLYADKVKRGKRTNGIDSHNKLRQLMDEAMGRLNIPSTDWERFYKESK